MVGDCVGHGLHAATIMGQLRSACRALLLENPSPSAVFAGMDSFAVRLPGARGATAFCAVLSPGTGELDLSNVDAFGQALAEATDGATVTVDFSGVEYLDSAAISLLFAYTEHIELVVNPILLPVLKISGLADVVDVHPAPPAAER